MDSDITGITGKQDSILDNIRYLMVLSVIVIHAAASYTSGGGGTVYDPKANTVVFTLIMLIHWHFAMPLFFFIAGYFALPNMKKKEQLFFLRDKFTRLGIPWINLYYFLAPVMIISIIILTLFLFELRAISGCSGCKEQLIFQTGF